MEESPDYLLDERAVERKFGISRRMLQALRWRGGGPVFVKLGRRIFYKREDIESWLEVNRRRSTSDSGPAAA